MKRILTASILLVSGAAFGQSCPIDIKNEVHLKEGTVSVYQQQEPKVVIDGSNQVFINGEKLDLDQMQQQALEAYHKGVQEHLPQLVDLANDGISIASDITNEIASGFDNPEAFDGVKKLIDDFSATVNDKFYQDDTFVIPADVFDKESSSWMSEFNQVIENISMESIESAFSALSEEMKQEGGINFSELKNRVMEMKASIEEKVAARSKEVEQKATNLCDSVQDLATEEQKLQELIPQLKDYQIFEI